MMNILRIIAVIIITTTFCLGLVYTPEPSDQELYCDRIINMVDKNNYEITLIFVRDVEFKSAGRIKETLPDCFHVDMQSIAKEFYSTYKDDNLIITWMDLPETEVFYVQYNVINNSCLKGKKFIYGSVQYINFDTDELGHCTTAPSKIFIP